MFDLVKRNFGFGCMRLPMKDGEVDRDEFCRMVDRFIEAGFNYFDTAHGYIEGKSELAIRDALASRHPRESFVLANKLTAWLFECEADIRPLFFSQLEASGVDYFDFYLLHAVNRERYEKHKACRSFDVACELKAEGRIKHIGMSFHDSADVLDMILTEQPSIEFVQLQINYLDYDDPTVQSKACYDVAVKHGKPVIVMEPVKGGALVNLPAEAKAEFDALGDADPVSYALRYAASFPGVFMVLSGMGNMKMLEENIASMHPFTPLSAAEREAADRAREMIRRYNQIPCTACKYCADVCPIAMPISETFGVYNRFAMAETSKKQTAKSLADLTPSAAECIGCGACEGVCPQSINIRERLAKIAKIK